MTWDGDEESEHEALALRHWDGRGAVRMIRADPGRRALLLERLHATDLRDLWDIEACEVVAGLWQHLHVPALPQLRTVTAYVETLGGRTRPAAGQRPGAAPAGPAGDVARRRPGERPRQRPDRRSTATCTTTTCWPPTVQPWLAIDPKPMNGDPHYEVAPMLWNRTEELAGDLRGGVRRRFHALVDAGGLDEDRARDWVVLREVLNAHWAAEDRRHRGRHARARGGKSGAGLTTSRGLMAR